MNRRLGGRLRRVSARESLVRPFRDADDLAAAWSEFKRSGADSLRNRLMEHYLFLVRFTAERIGAKLPDEVDVDDLMSAGVFGLADALDAFDLEAEADDAAQLPAQVVALAVETPVAADARFVAHAQLIDQRGQRGFVVEGVQAAVQVRDRVVPGRHARGRFGPGDFDEADDSVEHHPTVEAGVPCICLVALDKGIAFQGWIGRLLQPLVRM